MSSFAPTTTEKGNGMFWGQKRLMQGVALAGCVAAVAACGGPSEDPVKRGQYLAATSACGDCHTPGAILGPIQLDKKFGGGDVGFQMPTGTFFPPNLTPDDETGLGKWTEAQIVTVLRTGVRPDGRILAEAMPWKHWYSQFTDADAMAIAKYLKTLPPLANKAPGPFGPSEKPTGAYFSIVVPGAPGAAPTAAPDSGTATPLVAPGEETPAPEPAQPASPQPTTP